MSPVFLSLRSFRCGIDLRNRLAGRTIAMHRELPDDGGSSGEPEGGKNLTFGFVIWPA